MTTRGPELRPLFADRGFRRLLGTRLVSQLADGILQAGLASYVLFSPERKATGAAIAASFAVLLLPYSVVGPFVGVLLDRWRRRQILVFSNVLRAALVALLAVQVAADKTGFVFVVTALVTLGVNRFYLSALSAALPHVTTPRLLVSANALVTTAGTICVAIGAGIGLGARVVLGSSTRGSMGVVLVAGGGYLLAAAIAATMQRDLLGPDPVASADGRATVHHETVREGVSYLHRCRPAWNAFAALGVVRLAFGALTVVVVLLQRQYFHAQADTNGGLAGVGLTFAALGVGVPIGALVTPASVRRWGAVVWVPVMMIVAGAALVVLALVLRPAVLVATAFVLGLTAQAVKVCVDSIVQANVDDQHRGLVFALYDVLFNAAFVAAAALAAFVVPADGRSPGVLVVTALALTLAGLRYRRVTLRTS